LSAELIADIVVADPTGFDSLLGDPERFVAIGATLRDRNS